MLEDPRIARMAHVLVDYSVSVRKGWEVAVVGAPVAMPLIKSICSEVIAKGAFPYVMYLTPWWTKCYSQMGTMSN